MPVGWEKRIERFTKRGEGKVKEDIEEFIN
jgi:hypothetical protein